MKEGERERELRPQKVKYRRRYLSLRSSESSGGGGGGGGGDGGGDTVTSFHQQTKNHQYDFTGAKPVAGEEEAVVISRECE